MSAGQPLARLAAQLETITPLSEAAKRGLHQLNVRVVRVDEGDEFIREGAQPQESCVLIDGFACRYKVAGGGQRQILSFNLPGDAPDLHSLYLSRADHGIVAMTPARIGFIPHRELLALKRLHHDLSEAFWKSALIQASILHETIVNIGRRTAIQRMAHMFCEIYVRLQHNGQADRRSFRLPLSQAALGEVVGLSCVHVNRTLQQLRREGLIESKGRHHTIRDWDRLRRVGDFDAAYLHLGPANFE